MPSVDVKIHEIKGRAAYVNRAVRAGEVVLQEEPYAAVLSDEEVLFRCHHCYQLSSSLQRCSKSKYARFCSVEHQRLSWISGYKLEAQALATCNPRVPTATIRLAARALWRKLREESQPSSDYYSSYASVNDLCSHWQDLDEGRMVTYAQMAVVVRSFMAGSGMDGSKLPEVKEIAQLLARFACNIHTICDDEMRSIGIGLYPLGSMFNHSCEPNCMQSFVGSTIQFKALRDLSPGEELTITYVELAYMRQGRREQLAAHYFFDINQSTGPPQPHRSWNNPSKLLRPPPLLVTTLSSDVRVTVYSTGPSPGWQQDARDEALCAVVRDGKSLPGGLTATWQAPESEPFDLTDLQDLLDQIGDNDMTSDEKKELDTTGNKSQGSLGGREQPPKGSNEAQKGTEKVTGTAVARQQGSRQGNKQGGTALGDQGDGLLKPWVLNMEKSEKEWILEILLWGPWTCVPLSGAVQSAMGTGPEPSTVHEAEVRKDIAACSSSNLHHRDGQSTARDVVDQAPTCSSSGLTPVDGQNAAQGAIGSAAACSSSSMHPGDGERAAEGAASSSRNGTGTCGDVGGEQKYELSGEAADLCSRVALAMKLKSAERNNLEGDGRLGLGPLHVLRMRLGEMQAKALVDSGNLWSEAMRVHRELSPMYELVYPPVWPYLGLHYALLGKMELLQEEFEASIITLKQAVRILRVTHHASFVHDVQMLLEEAKHEASKK